MIENVIICVEDRVFARYIELEIKDSLPECAKIKIRSVFTGQLNAQLSLKDTILKNIFPNSVLIADLDAMVGIEGNAMNKLLKEFDKNNIPALLFGQKEQSEYFLHKNSSDVYSGAIFLQRPFPAKAFRCEISKFFAYSGTDIKTTAEPFLLSVDKERMILRNKASTASLTEKEFQLFIYLNENLGRSVSRDELIKYVWNGKAEKTNIIDVYISYLRAKLNVFGGHIKVASVRGIGYKLEIN